MMISTRVAPAGHGQEPTRRRPAVQDIDRAASALPELGWPLPMTPNPTLRVMCRVTRGPILPGQPRAACRNRTDDLFITSEIRHLLDLGRVACRGRLSRPRTSGAVHARPIRLSRSWSRTGGTGSTPSKSAYARYDPSSTRSREIRPDRCPAGHRLLPGKVTLSSVIARRNYTCRQCEPPRTFAPRPELYDDLSWWFDPQQAHLRANRPTRAGQ